NNMEEIVEFYESRMNQVELERIVVNYWVNQTSIENKKKSGRIRKTSPTTDDLIFLMSTANPFMSAAELKDLLKLSLSKQTIRNRLKEKGLSNYTAVKKEFLTTQHKQKRLEFAHKYQNWTAEQWKKVCFSDEKVFSTFGKGDDKDETIESKLVDSMYEISYNHFKTSIEKFLDCNIWRKTLNFAKKVEFYRDLAWCDMDFQQMAQEFISKNEHRADYMKQFLLDKEHFKNFTKKVETMYLTNSKQD
ncbi:hypothetical protein NPIL_466191, partial [Nephila pilipes]